jgi:hypothetical protein
MLFFYIKSYVKCIEDLESDNFSGSKGTEVGGLNSMKNIFFLLLNLYIAKYLIQFSI